MTSANAAMRLLAHYSSNARTLPWRASPGGGKPDPYRVWLSEVMLQQTTVAAVTPRFERFIERWPSLEALAAAPEDDVLSEWAGLGYYARARNLIACARAVADRGSFPDTSSALRQLPGLGEYTAAAVAAIAFGEPCPVVDTNVNRVIARLHGLRKPLPDQIRSLVQAMIPAQAPGDFAQAMMDLGATICRPKQPSCQICPLRPDCAAAASGDAEQFPAPKVKAIRPHRYGTAEWIERGGEVLLVRRPSSGLLGGMAALPGNAWKDDRPSASAIARITHVFTHFSLELAIVAGSERGKNGWWQPIASLDKAGLPTLYRKAVDAVLAVRTTRDAA
jgi:A/G-specific adenine glycosylase